MRALPADGRTTRIVRDTPAVPLAGTRDVAARLFQARGRRERIALTLVLGEQLRPIEAAVALGVSVRQVNRTVSAFLAELARAAGRAAAPGRRARRTARSAA